MRRPLARLLAVALTAVVFALPSGARAVPFVTRTVECRGVAVVGDGETSCAIPFVVNDSRTPSQFETHANFHARSSRGRIVMEWWDDVEPGATPRLVAAFDCSAPGMFMIVDMPGGFSLQAGPADIAATNCTRTTSSDVAFAQGLQALVVRATAADCMANDGSKTKCPFHGYLALERSSIP